MSTETTEKPRGLDVNGTPEEITEHFKEGMESGEIPMPPPPGKQLTMKIGGEAVGMHLFGSLKVKGTMGVRKDMNLGDELRVQIVDEQGEIVASGAATVQLPAFKKQVEEGVVIGIERVHTAELP